jgi:coenzyme F420 hydrogenase subunit delta
VVPELYKKKTLILGCGNILFGDDGFGPELCKYLIKNCKIPEDVGVEDCGTGVREILFDILLSEERPEEIIIVDAVDMGKMAGELFWVELEELPKVKVDDFSMHQFPTSNLLQELRDGCGVRVLVLSCQLKYIPKEVEMGLSKEVEMAIPKAAGLLMKRWQKDA